jgi:glycosyltransferase involved in cell wall biosynthesis
MDKVSVIIPTRNRKESLFRILGALSQQKTAIHEVIIVDSSDVPIDPSELENRFDFTACSLIRTAASVCIQRNEGIRRATGDFVLVLDDDNLLDTDYIAQCLAFFERHPAALIVSGLIVERNLTGGWDFTPPRISLIRLIWSFVFQLSIWTDLGEEAYEAGRGFLFTRVRGYFLRRGNGISRAGWPILTCFSQPFFRTQIYYLSAAMIKREWLAGNPYDERLDRHGIGENYGIAIKLQPEQGIFILADTYSRHDKSPANRLTENDAYYKRVLALDYFSSRHGTASRRWLVWSLFGNFLDACMHLRRDRVILNGRLIGILCLGRNPLLS